MMDWDEEMLARIDQFHREYRWLIHRDLETLTRRQLRVLISGLQIENSILRRGREFVPAGPVFDSDAPYVLYRGIPRGKG